MFPAVRIADSHAHVHVYMLINMFDKNVPTALLQLLLLNFQICFIFTLLHFICSQRKLFNFTHPPLPPPLDSVHLSARKNSKTSWIPWYFYCSWAL